jgi:hypothetical protein
VLLSGEHPMLANGASEVRDMSPVDAGGGRGEAGGAAGGAMTDADNAANPRVRQAKNAGGGKKAALQGRTLGNIPQLNGLQQIVGLALGSPEFQRH